MRPIIYRGQRLDNGKWEYGDLIENQGRFFIYHASSESTIKDNDDGQIVVCAVEVDPATVGQYTGLKDKNGRDIYEGDIIGFSKNGRIAALNYHVKWIRGGFWLTDGGYGDKLENQLRDIQSFAESAGYVTLIIGNIFDNTELKK